MNLLNKWIRVIHRWLAVPLVLAVAGVSCRPGLAWRRC
jgi:hypothetical protein